MVPVKVGRLREFATPRLLIVFVARIVGAAACAAPGAEYDLIIRGGSIVDGTGADPYEGDIGIREGRIASIGTLSNARADRVIDASGLSVAPGFIDLHTHSEDTLPVDGNGQSQVRQGVTLVLLSEGQGVAPLGSEAALEVVKQNMAVYGADVTWKTGQEYFSQLLQKGTAINVATYVSLNQVKRSVMGYDTDRVSTSDEMEEMKAQVADAMEQVGAWGIVGVFPRDGSYDPLLQVVKQKGGGLYSHIRNEGFELVQAVEEAVNAAERTGIPVHIFRFKIRGRKLWGQLDQPIAIIERAREKGLKITANQYPYTAMQHEIENVFPRWVQSGSKADFVERLKDPETRRRIKRDSEFLAYVDEHGGWDNIVASVIRSEKNKQFEGKSIAVIARERGVKDPADACMDLLSEEEEGWVGGVHFAMSEDDVKRIMRLPWVSIASDGRALATTGILARGTPHPRNFGTNPRVLGKYVRDEAVLTLEDAVRKMTGLPASILGLEDRGLLKTGMAADIVVFDAAAVADKATYEQPHQYPAGIPFVIVNGTVVIDGGKHTGARPGQLVVGPGHTERTRHTE